MAQSGRRGWRQLCLGIVGAALGIFTCSCEPPQKPADRKVAAAIAASDHIAQCAGSAAQKEKDQQKAYDLLKKAAEQADTSDLAKSHVKTLLAQSDYENAIARLAELTSAEAGVDAIIDEMAQLGQQIAANNLLIEQCKSLNPAGVGADQPSAKLAKSNADYTAMAGELGKKILAAEARVREKNGEMNALASQQTAAAGECASFLEKSEKTAGQESLDLFKKSADARVKAEGVTLKLNAAKRQLASLELSVAELKAQKQIALAGATAAAQQLSKLTAAWSKAQQVMQTTAADSKAIAGKVAAKSKALDSAMKAAKDKRDVIDNHLQLAIRYYTDAGVAAGAVNLAMRQRLSADSARQAPERLAWQRMESLHSPSGYHLDRARALMTRGELFIAQKSLLEGELRLAQSLTGIYGRQSGLTLPAELNVRDIASQITTAANTAKACFGDADTLLQDIMERGQSEDKSQAQFPRIGTQYALYNLTGKDSYLTEARKILQEIAAPSADEDSAKIAKAIPVLPEELEKGIVKRTGLDLSAGPTASGPVRGTGKESATWRKMLMKAFGGGGSGEMPAPETQPTTPPNPDQPAPAPNQ